MSRKSPSNSAALRRREESRRQPQRDGDESQAAAALLYQSQRFEGPIPPPEWLARYEEMLPGSAQIIFDQWPTESRHRQSEERLESARQHDRIVRAQWMGLAAVVSYFIVCALAIWREQPNGLPFAAGGAALLALCFGLANGDRIVDRLAGILRGLIQK